MANPTAYYVDPAINANSGSGTIGDPWGDLQWALDHITRDATNGDIIHIKAGAAEVSAASLTLATYGTLTETAPLILRGYTAAAGDGGVGEIDCNGATMWAGNPNLVILVDLEIHNGGDNHLVSSTGRLALLRCELHKGASTPTSKSLVSIGAGLVSGCYLHDGGTTPGMNGGASSICLFNYLIGAGGLSGAVVIGNVVVRTVNGNGTQFSGDLGVVLGNVFYSTVANTATAIGNGTGGSYNWHINLNNIVCGWSGAGGKGLQGNLLFLGHNAFFNNTTNESVTGGPFMDLGGDVSLAADPFTNAAGGDFSLTTAAKAALRGVGWPAAYLGAHANTDGHVTIGAVQYGEAEAGGGGLASPIIGNVIIQGLGLI